MSQHYPNGRPTILPLMRVRLNDGTVAVILSKLGYVNSINYFDAIAEPSGLHLTVYENSVVDVIDKDVRVHKVKPSVQDLASMKDVVLIARSDVGLEPSKADHIDVPESRLTIDPKLISSILNMNAPSVFKRSTCFKKFTRG